MPMGNHYGVSPPLTKKGSIVSLSGDYKENCARKANSSGHSAMCAEMCRVNESAPVSQVPLTPETNNRFNKLREKEHLDEHNSSSTM